MTSNSNIDDILRKVINFKQMAVNKAQGEDVFEHVNLDRANEILDGLVNEAKQAIKELFPSEAEIRLDELNKVDQQFPDLWKRGKAEYKEADMWKLAHYLTKRTEALESGTADTKEKK